MALSDAFILLVEDNEDDIFLTLRTLKQHSVANDVMVVRDGAEALDFLFARGKYGGRRPDQLPQVVLLDINLPKLSGLEVLKELRRHEATRLLPVVMLTSSRQEQDIIDSYDNRANSYVQKPVDSQKFSDAIRQVGVYWLALNEVPRP